MNPKSKKFRLSGDSCITEGEYDNLIKIISTKCQQGKFANEVQRKWKFNVPAYVAQIAIREVVYLIAEKESKKEESKFDFFDVS